MSLLLDVTRWWEVLHRTYLRQQVSVGKVEIPGGEGEERTFLMVSSMKSSQILQLRSDGTSRALWCHQEKVSFPTRMTPDPSPGTNTGALLPH